MARTAAFVIGNLNKIDGSFVFSINVFLNRNETRIKLNRKKFKIQLKYLTMSML
jgi:hypothetical protein